MKQCRNPNCTIYNILEELPDAYVQCPLCKEPLVEVTPAGGGPSYARLPNDQPTSFYIPVSQPKYGQSPLHAGNPYAKYEDTDPEYEAEEEADDGAGPQRVAQARGLTHARSWTIVAAIFALLAACALLTVIVGSRLLPQSPASSSTAIIMDTPGPEIAARGSVTVDGKAGDQGPATKEPTPGPRPPAPIMDALMCAKLEAGQPIGPTHAYHRADLFNLAVQAAFGPNGVTTALTRWYGPDGAPIYDLKQSYTQQGTYYAGFTLKKASPWAVGDYRVEIYTNGSTQPVQTVSFSVIQP